MGVFSNQKSGNQYVWLTIIICVFSSIFLPFVFVFLLQDILFHSNDYWFFTAPGSAYFTFMAGMLWISIVLAFYLLIKNVREKKGQKTYKWIFVLALSMCVIFFYLGINNYYYFTDDGLYYSDLFSLNGQHYTWGEYQKVNQIIYESGYRQGLAETVFITQDGKELRIPNNYDFSRHNSKIIGILKEHDVEIGKIYVNK